MIAVGMWKRKLQLRWKPKVKQPNVLLLGELDNLPAALQELTHEDADLAAELLNKPFNSGKVRLKNSHHRICIYKTENK